MKYEIFFENESLIIKESGKDYAKESLFWLKVIKRLEISNDKEYLEELGRLLKEAREIKQIFASISNKVRQTLSKKS